ncbi:MAG: Kazal-type serine protease inhibitor, partial [Candidatus Micrarchaeota archaeon]
MVKLSNSLIVYGIFFVLIIGFIAFLSLPKEVSDARRLKTERLVKLVNVPQISFASVGEQQPNLTVDVTICPPDGHIVPQGEPCLLLTELNETQNLTIENIEPINCDVTIENPVCTSSGVTYINDCFARAAGETTYTPGLCEETGGQIIDSLNVIDLPIDGIIETGIGFDCKILVPIPATAVMAIPAGGLTNINAYSSQTSISPIDLDKYSNYVANVKITKDKFSFNGPYYDDRTNTVVNLQLAGINDKVYFYNPDEQQTIELNAQMKVTNIPLVSNAISLNGNTKANCEEQKLSSYSTKQCKGNPALNCKSQAQTKYITDTCKDKTDKAACGEKILQ